MTASAEESPGIPDPPAHPNPPASPESSLPPPLPAFDLPGTVRRVRRTACLSQRALAQAVGLAPSTIGRVETGRSDLGARTLAAIAGVAGLRLAVVDADGREVLPMRPDGARDRGYRRFPAHVDVRHGDDRWWFSPHRHGRTAPTYTFSLDKYGDRPPVEEDHPVPTPEDDLGYRAERRRWEELRARRARDEEARREHQRRLAAGLVEDYDLWRMCECPPGCLALLEGDDPAGQQHPHVESCPCQCDIH